MLVAQITDLHVAPDGSFMRQFVDSNDAARAGGLVPQHDDAAARRRARDRRPHRPRHRRGVRRCCVRSSARSRCRCSSCPATTTRSTCCAPEYGTPEYARDSFDYVVDDFPVRLVALDSTVVGRHDGEARRRAARVARRDARRRARPSDDDLPAPPAVRDRRVVDGLHRAHRRARARGGGTAASAGAPGRRRTRAPVGHQHVGHHDREHRAEHVPSDGRSRSTPTARRG